MTRTAYAHDAVVILDPGGDSRAPGGAITVALCGHWDHEPPCPLAPTTPMQHPPATRRSGFGCCSPPIRTRSGCVR